MRGILKKIILLILPLLSQLYFNPFDEELLIFDNDDDDEAKVGGRSKKRKVKRRYVLPYIALIQSNINTDLFIYLEFQKKIEFCYFVI